ncbi:MAG TPA: pyridoxal-dependent decarboxylase, partial [Acidobacteriaceae bacterium]|nr:pyridoxal-dependent decarboxylase [Acidobacteriaceae bacterium]
MRRLAQSDGSFLALANRIASFAADYLHSLPDLPCFPADARGDAVAQLFREELPLEGMGAAAFDRLPEVFHYARPASPRFFGYVYGSGEPIGVLGDFAAGVLHQNATAWRSGPAAATIERTVIGWLAESVGCPGFSGSLTLGGSSANLMGLCMAREAKAPANQHGAQAGIVYCSTEAHMSIARAAALLGLGYERLRLIPVDADFRMRSDALRTAIDEDLRRGLRPIAVVASAGTTATGSIDPLAAIADLCQEHG